MADYQSSMPLFDRPSPAPVPLNPTVPEEDVPRLSAKSQALLTLLGDLRWHVNSELQAAGGFRYSARLEELKKAGHPWKKEHVVGGLWRYRLLDRGEP